MKKLSLLILCLALLAAAVMPCYAESSGVPPKALEKYSVIGDMPGIEVQDNVARSSTITSTHSRSYTNDGKLIAEIAVTGTFRYDGRAVSVLSKSISKCTTYDGWSFQKSSFISSGGSIVLTGTLTKSGKSVDVFISLSCDPDGNIC